MGTDHLDHNHVSCQHTGYYDRYHRQLPPYRVTTIISTNMITSMIPIIPTNMITTMAINHIDRPLSSLSGSLSSCRPLSDYHGSYHHANHTDDFHSPYHYTNHIYLPLWSLSRSLSYRLLWSLTTYNPLWSPAWLLITISTHHFDHYHGHCYQTEHYDHVHGP